MKEEGFIMKTCEKCGKEFADEILKCPDCSEKAVAYEQALKNAKITNIVGIALIVVGVICALFVNIWVGAVLCLVAELACLLPNSKVQKLFKQNNTGVTDKKKLKADSKALTKELKSKNKDYKLSFIIALISLAFLIIFVISNSVITGWANSLPSDLQKASYGSGIINQIDTIGDLEAYSKSEFHNYSDDSGTTTTTEKSSDSSTDTTESSDSNKYATEPIVGSFDYSNSVFADTPQISIQMKLPYISHLNFEADGTGNVTIKTEGNPGFAIYDATWSLYDEQENYIIYLVTLDNGEVGYVYYVEDADYCFMIVDNEVINYYERYSGNAQDNISGITTSEAYDVIGSYRFSYAYNPNTGSKTTTPSVPYTYYLTICEGNSCLVQAQTNTTSNAYGLEFYSGTWSYEKKDGDFFSYKMILNQSVTMAFLYSPEYDMCIVSDNNGILYYLERVED